MKYQDIESEARSAYPTDSNRYHPTFERDEYIALNANNIKMKSCQQAHISAATAERERMMAFIVWKDDKCKKIPFSNCYRYNDVWYTLRELHEIFLKENK